MPDAEDGLASAIGRAERRQVTIRALMLGTGPRFARDAVGPVLAFYLGWKLVGLPTGIIVATAATVAAYLWERRQVIINAAYGLAFLCSVLVRRPLAGVFASETYPFPSEVKTSRTFIRVFSHVSVVWAAYLLGRSALRLIVLIRGTVEGFIAVNVLTGFPLSAAIVTWSIWYGVRAFRRSDEWGPSLSPGARA